MAVQKFMINYSLEAVNTARYARPVYLRGHHIKLAVLFLKWNGSQKDKNICRDRMSGCYSFMV